MARSVRPLLVIAALGALAAAHAAASSPGAPRESWAVRQWTVDDGLPQSSVTSLARTADGALLVGTFGGLVRFDGSRFVSLHVTGPSGLGSARVLTLSKGPDGTVWVGVESGGLGRLEGDHVVALPRPGALAGRSVSRVVADGAGRVWAISGPRLFRVGGGEPVEVPLPGEHRAELHALAEGTRGELLVATEAGEVFRIGSAPDARVEPAWTTVQTSSFSVLRDRAGALWVGGSGRAVNRLTQDGSATTWELPDGPTSFTRALLQAGDGTVWATPSRLGLCRVLGGTLEPTALPAARSGMIRALLEDDEGGLWVGTEGAGLFLVRRTPMTSFGPAEGLPEGSVRPVAMDARGDVWAAIGCSGVVRIRDGVVDRAEALVDAASAPRLARQCVWALLPARDGTVWLGTWSGRLARIAGGRFDWVPDLDSLLLKEAASIVALFEDSRGTIWVGTRGAGLHSLAQGRWRGWGRDDGLPGVDVCFVTEGPDGRIWTAGAGGVAVLRDGRFRPFGPAEGLPSPQARIVVPEADGTTWVGTYGGGLAVLREGRAGIVDSARGLREDIVSWLHPSRDGWVWFTGNRGVYRARRENLLAAAFGGGTTPARAFRWGEEDGLPSSETNGGFQPSGWAGPDGRLLVPTIAGLASIDPHAATGGEAPVPVRVERVDADGTRVPLEGGIARIPARTARVQVRYAPVLLRSADRTFFRTRVDGLDRDWVDAGTSRELHLSSPHPGRLVVRVAASGEGDRWGEPASVVLEVAPAWHETKAVRLLALLALVGALAAVPFGKSALLARRARALERVVAERTAALAEANRQLGELAQTDELTGLDNVRSLRRSLETASSRASARGRPVSLLMIDVDFFKPYNDALGHPAGDECLRRLAACFRDELRNPADLASRYGGEEFAVLLPDTPAEGAALAGERLRRHVEALAIAHPASAVAPVVTVSVGVATSAPPRTLAPDELVAEADAALYRAKAGGRNRVVASQGPSAAPRA